MAKIEAYSTVEEMTDEVEKMAQEIRERGPIINDLKRLLEMSEMCDSLTKYYNGPLGADKAKADHFCTYGCIADDWWIQLVG